MDGIEKHTATALGSVPAFEEKASAKIPSPA
jgi:hypothetical protein